MTDIEHDEDEKTSSRASALARKASCGLLKLASFTDIELDQEILMDQNPEAVSMMICGTRLFNPAEKGTAIVPSLQGRNSVPAFPLRASGSSSRLVITPDLPVLSTKLIMLLTFGSMLPLWNSPAAR